MTLAYHFNGINVTCWIDAIPSLKLHNDQRLMVIAYHFNGINVTFWIDAIPSLKLHKTA